MNVPLASLIDARKSYGKTVALNGLSFEVHRGEIVSLLGANGAGKTTAISLLLGLTEPDSGVARLFGAPPQEIATRRGIGVMLQESVLSADLRVDELIELTSSYYPSPRSAEEVIALAGIDSFATKRYGRLSGGQKRQAQFALAICGRPQMLFLDEPTVGLDVNARQRLWSTVARLSKEGAGVILTTHYLEEAEALANRVVVIAGGALVTTGTVREVCALVLRKRVSCITRLDPDELRTWADVESVAAADGQVEIVTTDAEALVRRLMAADDSLTQLEIERGGLAEAFSKLTEEVQS